ncbi:MAG TPA: hypothetical protein VFI35_01955, partial [Actinomycetota bacterium]|nr:hypothetical protein [Actinomycetota bacterium]
MRRALVAVCAGLALLSAPAHAQGGRRSAILIETADASLRDLLNVSEIRTLAALGGSALMNGRTGSEDAMADVLEDENGEPISPPGLYNARVGDLGIGPAVDILVAEGLSVAEGPTLVLIVSRSPLITGRNEGDELGAVVAAWVDPDEMLDAAGQLIVTDEEPKALTSDSSRRAGVVADVDPAATLAAWLGLPYDAGAPIERTGEPAPLDLYERYLQQRRLAVPIAAVSWGGMLCIGLAAVVALTLRSQLSSRTLRAVEVLTSALPWLALGLLLVGHLPILIVATVVPFLIAFVAAG